MTVQKTYEKYRDSGVEWIGEIPEHWAFLLLKRYCSKISDGSHFSPITYPDGIPYVTVKDIYNGVINFENCKFINENDYVSMLKSGCNPRKNDVLLTKDGTIGRAAVVIDDMNFVVLSSLGIVTPNLKRIYPKFLFYWLESLNNVQQMESYVHGAALTRLTIQIIKKLYAIFPPVEEQINICVYLDRKTAEIDALIADKEKLIELLQEKRQAIISEAVTKGLDKNVKTKDSGIEWIGEIPENWEISRFRRFCSLQQGLQIAQSERFYEPDINRYEYLTVKSIHLGESNESKEYIEKPSNRVICEKDDVLLARTGATGEVISGFQGVFHNNFFKVNFNREMICKNYLILYLMQDGIQKYLKLIAGTTTIPDLNHSDFLDTVFLLPPIHEQEKIEKYINQKTTDIDSLISIIKTEISKLKEYRQSLISEVVTGKIDVRGETYANQL